MLAKDGDLAWQEIVAKYDQYSTREFLELSGWSEGMIEMFGLLANQEAVMNSSFLELFREDSGNYYTNMVEIDGGTDRLPYAFLPALRSNIRFGAKMIVIDQSPDDVTIHYQTQAGRFAGKGDYAIITVPFPVLRHVEVLKPFTRAKQRAIRQLHYDASAKILFQCRRRHVDRSASPQPVLSRSRARDRTRCDPGQLHLVRGCAALGLAQAV
jgi:monoamine oxidase